MAQSHVQQEMNIAPVVMKDLVKSVMLQHIFLFGSLVIVKDVTFLS